MFVAVDEGFGVAEGGEGVSEALELGAEFAVVVDFAVEDDGAGAVFVEDGLPAAGEVDDAEASHAHLEAWAFVAAFAVGASVDLDASHAVEQTVFIKPGKAVDTAHENRENCSCSGVRVNSTRGRRNRGGVQVAADAVCCCCAMMAAMVPESGAEEPAMARLARW